MKKIIRIQGKVNSLDWDSQGNITEAMIETENGENFILSHNAKSKELLEFIDNEVLLSANVVGKDIAGNRIIETIEYRILKSFINFV